MATSLIDIIRGTMDRASIALTAALTDAPDHPLAAANEAFFRLTGYGPDDVLGRNCRILQRERRDQPQLKLVRMFLADDRQDSVRVPLLNFRHDGAPFINLVFMSKLRDPQSRAVVLFASQFDVSRSHAEELRRYDASLADVLSGLRPVMNDHGIVLRGSLHAVANATALLAQARLTMARLDHIPVFAMDNIPQ